MAKRTTLRGRSPGGSPQKKRKKRRGNPSNKEWEQLISISEGGSVAAAKKSKHDEFRQKFGLPSSAWKRYITDHLRRAGLKGRSFENAQKAMIEGARRWRMARAYGSPIYPIANSVGNGRLQDFEIMKYVGPNEHDYYPHRAHLRQGARVIVTDTSLLKRQQVPVITRGKGYLFLVKKSDLMFVVPQLTKRQLEEARREFELYLESPEAKALDKKYGIR